MINGINASKCQADKLGRENAILKFMRNLLRANQITIAAIFGLHIANIHTGKPLDDSGVSALGTTDIRTNETIEIANVRTKKKKLQDNQLNSILPYPYNAPIFILQILSLQNCIMLKLKHCRNATEFFNEIYGIKNLCA